VVLNEPQIRRVEPIINKTANVQTLSVINSISHQRQSSVGLASGDIIGLRKKLLDLAPRAGPRKGRRR
jgi:hypothetical protein